MNTECPSCESENAFHNGVNFECPDCDYEWNQIKTRNIIKKKDERK